MSSKIIIMEVDPSNNYLLWGTLLSFSHLNVSAEAGVYRGYAIPLVIIFYHLGFDLVILVKEHSKCI